MDTQEIDVHINYLDGQDSECPYIRCPGIPRAGERVVTPSGKQYTVRNVIWDDKMDAKKLIVRIEVSPIRK